MQSGLQQTLMSCTTCGWRSSASNAASRCKAEGRGRGDHGSHAVAVSTTCGRSLYYMRLQPRLHTWKAEEEALESKNFLTATRTPAYSAS